MAKANKSRRNFIKFIGVTGGYATLSTWSPLVQAGTGVVRNNFYKSKGPINYHVDLNSADEFLGDNPFLKAHPILWNKNSYLKDNPPMGPAEIADVVIVGGGMSGLSCAYLLRKYKPIVLEQSSRFGGNSKAEVLEGVSCSVGAAYFMEQKEDSEIYKLFHEINIHSLCKIREEEDQKLLHGVFYKNFWSGETDLKNKQQFQILSDFFKNVNNETAGYVYPEIPLEVFEINENKKMSDYLKKLDGYNFKDYLEKVVLKNEKLLPHIEQSLERYIWSAFACSMNEISAAMAINAYAAEFGKAYVAPGGNAKVAERFLQKGLETIPESNYRTDSLVFDVKVEKEYTTVIYSDDKGKIKQIKAKTVVLACPKFVVKKILNDIEPERMACLEKLKYRSYLVSNVVLNKSAKLNEYDTYIIGENLSPEKSNVSDVILANYAEKIKNKKTVLTLYRAFPFEGGRKLIFEQDAYQKYRDEILNQLKVEILPAFGYQSADIKYLRIQRWGHPLPLPSVGLIADGTIDQIRKPFKGKVFFVEQDNWMMPSLETAIGEAMCWSKEVMKTLKG